MSAPRLLDLFCGAGGAARGYQLAGFHVTGVDNRPQPRYAGDAFVLGDALEFCAEHGREFDAIHASPPCQRYSGIRDYRRCATPKREWDSVPEVQDLLRSLGRPYVIENVPGAPLLNPITLCGVSFGLKVYRHRCFESSLLLLSPPHQPHPETVPRAGYGPSRGGYISVSGNFTNPEAARRAMGIDWMTRDGLAQAIPPAYTLFVGRQLREVLR